MQKLEKPRQDKILWERVSYSSEGGTSPPFVREENFFKVISLTEQIWCQ